MIRADLKKSAFISIYKGGIDYMKYEVLLSGFDITDIPNDKYDLGALIRMLNLHPEVNPEGKKAYITKMIFFIRTMSGNMLVADKKSGVTLFEPTIRDDECSGINPNDAFMFFAKEALVKVFRKDVPLQTLGMSTFPTPFGVRRINSTDIEAVFQIVVNSTSLTSNSLKDEFEYVSISCHEDSKKAERIYAQIKKTED